MISARLPKSLGERRSWWIAFLAKAVAYAEGRAAGRPVDRMERAQFAHELSRVAWVPFPLPHVSAKAIGEALIAAGQGLIHVECLPEREVLAALTLTAARGLDQLLREDACQQSATWERRVGGS